MGSNSNNSKNLKKSKPLRSTDLFTKHFMNLYTHYDTLHDFFKNGGFNINSTSLYKINLYVKETTEFSNFQEMLQAAGEEFIMDIINHNI